MRNSVEKRTLSLGDRRVGFYGCNNKVVRLERDPSLIDQPYPRRLRLPCPGCGHEHDARPHWRKYDAKLDERRDPDYVVVE